jgi:hypothetical protein
MSPIGNVCYDKVFSTQDPSSNDGNVVLLSAYGQYFAGILGHIAEFE